MIFLEIVNWLVKHMIIITASRYTKAAVINTTEIRTIGHRYWEVNKLACHPFYQREFLLPACCSCLRAYVYQVPRLVPSCIVHSCITREGFRFVCKSCVLGCAHVECVFLLAGKAHASVKFKSSCAVLKVFILYLSTLQSTWPRAWWYTWMDRSCNFT